MFKIKLLFILPVFILLLGLVLGSCCGSVSGLSSKESKELRLRVLEERVRLMEHKLDSLSKK